MTQSLLITTDPEVRERWAGAFPGAPCLACTAEAQPLLDTDTIVWLHLPHDDAAAKGFFLDAHLLEPSESCLGR